MKQKYLILPLRLGVQNIMDSISMFTEDGWKIVNIYPYNNLIHYILEK